MNPLIPAIVLLVAFVILLCFNWGRMNGASELKEKNEFKQKVFLYAFASVVIVVAGIVMFVLK